MPKFELVPCKIREDRVVRKKGAESVAFTGPELMRKFLLDPGNRIDLVLFRSLVPESYIGLSKSSRNGRPVRFYLRNDDLTGDLSWVLKRDPTFADRVLEVWLIDRSEWDSRVIEQSL